MTLLAASDWSAWLSSTIALVKVLIGFSLIIFVHELGHFLAAKWVGVRVDRFAVGFGYRLFGWRRGEGFTFGHRPALTAEELQQRGWGETDYCFKALPLGGYVKMLGQEDVQINEKTGEVKLTDDPRSFTNKPIGQRMVVVSAGVVFNLLFAILLFMWVFMLGKKENAPQIGELDPSSPAAQAGLRSGDVVLTANGHKVLSFRDVYLSVLLADDGVVRFTVQHADKPQPEEVVLRLDPNKEDLLESSGLLPAGTTELLTSGLAVEGLPGLKPGDRITHVGGQKVETAATALLAMTLQVAAAGDPLLEFTVERPDVADPSKFTTHTAYYRTGLLAIPSDLKALGEKRLEQGSILGFLPRRKVAAVEPGQPGDQAGLKPGDVVVQWGTVVNPLYDEIVAGVRSHPGQPLPVVVERNGQALDLTLTPKRPFQLLGKADAKAFVGFGRIEEERTVVADVVPNSPAAALRLPRGSVLKGIDGQPVQNWFEALRVLKAAAGRRVAVHWAYGPLEATGELTVPSSLVDALDLPVEAVVLSIDGQTRVSVGTQTLQLPNPLAIKPLLESRVGQTVEVRYRNTFNDPEIHTGKFTVAPDLSNVDPWQMFIMYAHGFDLRFAPLEKEVKTGNPLAAAWYGVKHTGLVLVEVYRSIRVIAKNLMAGRTGSTQYVSGPVGIVGHAIDRAKMNFAELLFFLGFLSVNLAVINFIPFPVVDGGLMVFLILEKIRGRPLGLKTQMITTLVGLATIILVFVLITVQDVSKFFR